ncbi:MAG: phage gp6-like head-tail connector protein [Sphingomonadales bacterium]|nr:phage gp6-like head-tail connector protein [Sphingomonadales bacterium]
MTIDQMRQMLGLAPELTDAQVVAAYAAHIGASPEAPTVGQLPVSLLEARDHLRLAPDETELEQQIVGFIEDAAAWVERYTGMLLTQREVTETLTGFSSPRLRAWPIAADASVFITYAGSDGAVLVDGARLNIGRRPAQLLPAPGTMWPRVAAGTPIAVTTTAGFANADDVPRNIRRAMLILISAFESDREGGDVFAKAEAAARRLCAQYRVRTL